MVRRDPFDIDHRRVAALFEIADFIQHIGDAARHAGGEIAADLAQHDDAAAGHVFAAMIADAFDDGGNAGIAHGEAFTGDATEITFAGNGAVQHGVADNDIVFGDEAALGLRIDDDAAARKTFADIVVGVAGKLQGNAARQPAAEALAGGSLHENMDGVVIKARMAIAVGNLTRQHGADGAVDVADRHFDLDRRLTFQGRARLIDQLIIQGLVEAVVLDLAVEERDIGIDIGLGEDAGEIQTLGLPVVDRFGGVEPVHASDHLIEGMEAQFGHNLAHFLGDEGEIVDDVFGLAGEPLAQFRVLGGDAGRAGVEVAFTHHDAALGYQGRGGKAELIGAQQGPDDDVASRTHAAVHLHGDAAAQPVENQGLVGFGQAQFPK